MGIYQYTDSQTGKTYSFEHGGDAPTNEDFSFMAQHIAQDRERLNQMAMDVMGKPLTPEDDRMAFRRGVDIGATSAFGALGTLARSTGEGTGIDFLRNLGAGMEQSTRGEQLREATQMPAPTRLADVEGVGDFLTFIGEGAGQTVPEMAATIGGGLAGGLFGGPKGFIAGSTAVGVPFFTGRNIQRQEQQVELGQLDEVNRMNAFLTAVPQAALNSVADKILLTGRALGLSVPASQNLFVRVGQFGAAGAVVEAPTEIAQQMMERAQAGMPLDSEDAIAEYLEAGVLGGVIGAGVGGGLGAFRGPEAPPAPPPAPPGATPPTATPPVTTPGPTREITDEDFADIGEGPADLDPTAPITAETLATLGVPPIASIYQQVAAERLSGPQLDAALERYAASAGTIPAQQAAARNVEQFLQRRAAAIPGQQELPLRRPTEPKRVEPSPAGVGPVSGAPADAQPRIDSDLGTPGGVELPAPVRMAVPNRGVGATPAPATPQPAALAGGRRFSGPISDAEYRSLTSAEQDRYLDEVGLPPPPASLLAAPAPEAAPAPAQLFPDAQPAQRPMSDADAFELAFQEAEVARAAAPAAQPIPEAAPAPAQLFPDAQPSPRPISDADAFDLAFQDAEAARAAAPTPTSAPAAPLPLAAAQTPPEVTPLPSADQIPALRRAARAAEQRAKSEVTSLKRPVALSMGLKLDPEGAAGQELLARGVTRKSAPGLFATKAGTGLKDIDNIPAIEHPQLMREGMVNVGPDGYFDRTDLLDALEDETRGTPRQSAAMQEAFRLQQELTSAEQSVAATEYAPPLQPNEDPFRSLKGIGQLYSETANTWDRPLSAPVMAALQNNDLTGALRELAASTKNNEIKRLINRLNSFVGGVRVWVADPTELRRLERIYGEGEPLRGVFIRSFSDEELQTFVDNNRYTQEQVDDLAVLENTIVLDGQDGVTPMVLLHEVVHAVTEQVVRNPSHPLTQRLEQILTEARAVIPGRVNELENVGELVAYGMTNPDFLKDLALVPSVVNGQRVSLLDRFTNNIANFLRSLFGRKTKPVLSAKDDLDMFFDAMLAPAPKYRGVGSVYSAAYRPDSSQQIMSAMKANVKLPTAAEAATAARRITDATILSPRAKSFLLDLSVPLLYVGDYAKQYMPSAPRVNDLVNEHAGYERRLLDWTNDTVAPISEYFRKHGQAVVDTINKIRYEATENEYQVDPRKPASEYNQFELTQVDYNPDGTEAQRTVRRFRTRNERNAAGQRLNRGAAPGRRRAVKFKDPDAARIAKHAELRALYLGLPDGGQAVVNRLFELPEVYRKELQTVFTERLNDMLPGQRAMQERIYREVFDKLFAETLLEPYQALSRRGDFKLSYEARDPDTGDLKVFKHAFATAAARTDAIMRLEAIQEAERANPGGANPADIRSITPYQTVNDFAGAGVQAPTAVLMSILNKVAERNQLGDPQVEQRILELIFETAPETSFIQSYKKRAGDPGYMGDITPLDERLSVGDTLDVVKTNGYRLATKAADIRYQTKFANLRSTLRDEYADYVNKQQVSEPDAATRAKNQADAKLYLDKLNDATRAPFQPVARWSQTLTALGYTMALGGNVSTAALTFFQLPLFIGPLLMGKYGGSTTTQAIGRATRVLSGSGREPVGGRFRTVERVSPDGGIERVRERVGMYDYSLANLDYDNDPKAAYLRPLFEAANAAGTLTRSMTQEQVDASTAIGLTQKIAAWSGLMQHHAERYMREITMISDYLANAYNTIPGMKNQMSFKQFTKAVEEGRVVIPADIATNVAADAVKFADYANGSIYAASAPKFAQGNLGRILYLFKRFPISMMNLLVHTARRSVDDSDPVDRRVARLQLAGMSGSMALFAGAAGMPLFHTVAALYDNLWPRDEDDEDFETLVRTGFLGELGTKGLANYLFGVNLSDRIGLAGIFFRPPLNSAELPWYGTIIEGYGGPVVGLGTRWARAIDFYSQGEYYRGLESTLPTAMSNMMKSFRFGADGARTLRGDPILESFSPYELSAQFFGFMPARYEQQLSINRAQQDIGKAVDQQVQGLLRRLYIARREGDRDSFQEVLQEIRDFNARMPPQARITRDSIRRSLESHQARTQEMVSGVTLSRRLQPQLMQLASEYGPVSWMDQR